MVNIGRSSTGCALCRKRKIKCDEGKPGCRRCAQAHKICPGYPFQLQLQLRLDQLPSAGVPATRDCPLGPIPPPGQPGDIEQQTISRLVLDKLQQNRIKAENSSSSTGVDDAATARRSISPPPRYDVQHQSLCFFVNLFCFQAGRLYSFPVLDFLPEVLQKADPSSCLHQAATAVSRLTLADRYSGKDVRLNSDPQYGHALKLAKATIRDTAASIQDETVLAVWLLGLYEHISVLLTHSRRTAESQTLEEEWQSHISHVRGAMRLLRLRGKSQFTTAAGKKIFLIFRAAIQLRLFILTSVTSKDFDDLEVDVFKEENEFVPSQTANKATAYFHRVAQLLEEVRVFLAHRKEDPAKTVGTAEDFVERGEALDEAMTGWSKDEPGWDLLKVRAATAGTMWALYPSHARYHFYSFWVYLYWIRFLTARIKLYEGLIELQKLLARAPADQRSSTAAPRLKISNYETIIQTTASELIGLTAYALGDVTPVGGFNSSASGEYPARGVQEINVVAAMQLVIPLKMLQRSAYPTATQKGAVDLAISHIGDGFRRQPLMFAG
ncbi:hypothetical protein EDD37DRAFT_645393 [Exophiala viscosa]|uniref:uncharacterized protein n=1 Tax=Exophiala viscosa TaxID=2486360 RepID=UPI00219B9211|nr:hypothetical protein EDD37DRAFT_645393 [Exophiala viscosa]